MEGSRSLGRWQYQLQWIDACRCIMNIVASYNSISPCCTPLMLSAGSSPCLCLAVDAWCALPTTATSSQQQNFVGIEFSSAQPWYGACSCFALAQTPATMADNPALADSRIPPITPPSRNNNSRNELSSIHMALQLLSDSRRNLQEPSTVQHGQALPAQPLAEACPCSSDVTGPSCKTPAATQPNPPVTCPPAPKRPMPPVMLVPAAELLGCSSMAAYNPRW